MSRLNKVKMSLVKERELEKIFRAIKCNRFLEIGCGRGFVLELLSKIFPESNILGMDTDFDRLKSARARRLKNAYLVSGNILDKFFRLRKFDVVICVDVLHEIFSQKGYEGIIKIFEYVREILKENGYFIIYDWVSPPDKEVILQIKNREIESRLNKFTRDFKPRKIRVERIKKDTHSMDAVDLVEFLSKYRVGDEDWEEEMKETHFFFNVGEYKRVIKETGFKIEKYRKFLHPGPPIEKEKIFSEINRSYFKKVWFLLKKY